jgi:hypothetical protein
MTYVASDINVIHKPYIEQVLEEFREKFVAKKPRYSNAWESMPSPEMIENWLKDTLIKFAGEVSSNVIGGREKNRIASYTGARAVLL